MVISSCPLRISLFGGSTDNPNFLKEYGTGSVISFTSNVKTYTTIFEDKLGYNKAQQKYIINYTNREEVSNIEEVKNELVRSFLRYYNAKPITINMHSDVYSQGSGLASSSSYLINLINCYTLSKNITLTNLDICKLALQVERTFNPYCGLQDPYGCGIGGFKKLDFNREEEVNVTTLSDNFFNEYFVFLIFTGITRNSKNILEDISHNTDKILPLLQIVDKAYDCIIKKDFKTFLGLINDSWEQKKVISKNIFDNDTVKDIDIYLTNSRQILAHRLCGAGAGGFFLAFSKDEELDIPYKYIKINLNNDGVLGTVL